MQIVGTKRRVLLDIMAFCCLEAVIWTFRQQSLKCALTLAPFVPTLAACAFFTYLCANRLRVFLISAGGAALGWVLMPDVFVECPNWYDLQLHKLKSWETFLPAVGATIAGLIVWVIELSAKTGNGAETSLEPPSGSNNGFYPNKRMSDGGEDRGTQDK